MLSQGKKSIQKAFEQKVALYGIRAVLLRAVKSLIHKCLKFTWEKCYLMSRELDEVQPPEERDDIKVRQLTIADYENDSWYSFFSDKKTIYEKRFRDNQAKAYGAFINGELAYSTWILYGEVVLQEKILLIKSDNCALLLDSYCHPHFRGKGLHNYMNQWSLYTMKRNGMENGYVIVLSYNRPAIKTQRKCSLYIKKKFYWFKVGKWEYCTIKSHYQQK